MALGLAALAACTPEDGSTFMGTGGPGDAGADTVSLAAASSSGQPGFGDVEVVCGVRPAQLGRKVDSRPEKGRATWTLYDTKPGSTAPRAFHVTGFADGCARRVTAALAMFGSVEAYELVHFSGLVSPDGSATDRTYASLRRGVCGSGNRPCTGAGLRKLSQNTAFLAAYPRKGSPTHLELLMHDGAIAATAQK